MPQLLLDYIEFIMKSYLDSQENHNTQMSKLHIQCHSHLICNCTPQWNYKMWKQIQSCYSHRLKKGVIKFFKNINYLSLQQQFGQSQNPALHEVHLLPEKLDLQVHVPLELHDEVEDPDILHPQAETAKACNSFYCIEFCIKKPTLTIRKSIIP